MKNKWLIIGILVMVIIAGILIAINAGRETSVSQPNATAVPAPTPAESTAAPTPATTPTVGSSGVIEITAEKLVKELLANPNKYKEGTVFQISGTLIKYGTYPSLMNFDLGPVIKTSSSARVSVSLILDPIKSKDVDIYNKLLKLNDGDWVVIRGTFSHFNPVDLGGALVKNVSLVSVTPTK